MTTSCAAFHSLELFAGAGGLARGLHEAGFTAEAVAERDRHACATLLANQSLLSASGFAFHGADVAHVDYTDYCGRVALLAAGAPCQPFSIAGRHRAMADSRNLFPEVFRAQRALLPQAVLIENARGLLRPGFADYVRYLELRLTYPTVEPQTDWRADLEALESHAARHTVSDEATTYRVVRRLLNAADYGVPQVRHRVFFVALRADLGVTWNPPAPTHSREALLYDQFVVGSYWDRHGLARPRASRRQIEEALACHSRLGGALSAWQTVRDAIGDLPDPRVALTPGVPQGHAYQPGARRYRGHSGSPLDWPSKAIKAGVHGVPGGENMLRHPNGRVRYFTIREAARLQGFPDAFEFAGAWGEAMRQIGNAVPVSLARAVAHSVRVSLESVNPAITA